MVASPTDPSSLRHVRRVQPLHFPEQEPDEEHLGQSTKHLKLCHALYDILVAAADPARNTIGADQFVYWNAASPRRCLAPDGFVKLGVPDHDFESYKTWIEGTPELAIEILSPSNTKERWTLPEKIKRYRELGVRELLVFNADKRAGARLAAWDRIDDDFVERVVKSERTPCLTLGCHAVVAKIRGGYVGLRLSRDAEGRDLYLLPSEQREQEAEARAHEAEARAREAEGRRRAEARVAELEAELARARAPKKPRKPGKR
jgi:hypothetical protein